MIASSERGPIAHRLKLLASTLFALLLSTPFTASGWTPHRTAVSPAVDAWSHEEACSQYCVSRFGRSCVSGVFHSFYKLSPTSGTGYVACTVTWQSGTRVVTDLFFPNPGFNGGAAVAQCGVSNSLISDDGNSCRCSPTTRRNGSACVPDPQGKGTQ